MEDKRTTESVVQEIMGLVDTLVASVNGAHLAKREDWRDACFQSADNLIVAIQSKLRELVELCSVREPLSDEVITMIDDSTHFHESTDWPIRFARNIERAHGITNTTKE